ncbi:MAG: YraN family protein [Marinifilaceae bacterium]|jgi:putative endonuclease|nr:YraN family protein [Marinifilaceae bacterium]
MNTKTKGNNSEEIAARHLISAGYEIINRNWICNNREIDIIAIHNSMLIIVEVKSIYSENIDDPLESISYSKIKNIAKATQDYIDIHEITKEVRFDIITVIKKKDKQIINHIKDAFTIPQY